MQHVKLRPGTLQRPLPKLIARSQPAVRWFRSARILSTEPTPDLYRTLGVARDATQAQIKQAYYSLSMQLHPDTNNSSPEAAKRFSAVAEAYKVLSQPRLRRRYDRPTGMAAGGGAGPASARRRGPLNYNVPYNFDEFFRKHYGEARHREQLRRRRWARDQQHIAGAQSGSSVLGLAVVSLLVVLQMWPS